MRNRRTQRDPARFRWFTAFFTVAGVVALAAALQVASSPLWGPHPLTVALFGLLVIVAELRPIPSLKDGAEVTASFTFGFALLLLAPSATGIALMGFAALAPDLRDRKRLARVAFNFGQLMFCMSLSAAAGSLVDDLQAVSNGGPVTVRWLCAVVVTCVVGYGANALIIGSAIALLQGVSVRRMLKRSAYANLGMDGLLLGLAPIFAVIGIHALLLVPLLLTTVWSIFASARLALNNRNEAHRDQLTALPNRRMFEEHAELLLDGATAAKDMAAVMQLDLNAFKSINDRFGHQSGDIVLKATAARLSAAKRADELVARLGGDEFAVIVRSVNSADDARRIAERLLRAIGQPIEVGDLTLQIGGSFGVAIFPQHGESLSALLDHADQAMYQAKSAGGGVALYGETNDDGPASGVALAAEITSGIESGEFFLDFQPIVDLASNQVITVEALVRWQHCERGLLLPDEFIPQAEKFDLITSLTDEVVRLATEQLAAWREAGISTRVVVNVATHDLHDLEFASRLAGHLGRHSLHPGCLEIELTEQTIMIDPDRSKEAIAELRSLGVGVGIDEFGTGYSSLPLLWELAPDRIKIDRSIIGGLDRAANRSIALAAVELCRSLGISIVAVGVATPDDLRIVRELGFGGAQGHLIARPHRAGHFDEALRSGLLPLPATSPTLNPFATSPPASSRNTP